MFPSLSSAPPPPPARACEQQVSGMRPPRPHGPPPRFPFHHRRRRLHSHLYLLVAPLLCFAFLTPALAAAGAPPAAAAAGDTGGEGGIIRTRAAAIDWPAMVWPSKCTWLPLPNSGRCHSYTLVSKYHKIWKDTKGVISATEVLKKEPVSDAIALKDSMKYFDADFFNDSKLREMEDGAKEFNIPAFRENRKLVASENGGLHNPSVLLFKSSWSGDSMKSEAKTFDYPRASAVHRPSNDEDIAFMSVTELGELIRTKQITSRELTDVFLRRLKRYNPVLEAVVTCTEDLAYKQAKEADDLLAQGNYLGPLHGIPYGLKDIIAVPRYKTTWGSWTFKNQVLDTEAFVYKRLKSAGAVLVAKLVTGSLAYDDIWFGGRTRNPWNIEEFSTGSSAGPAASTSAGMVPFAIGSETAGSITYPAARCGVTALRPTFGTVARTGVMSISESLVLNRLFTKAGELGMLQPLSRGFTGQRISLYADDVALFIRPLEDEMNLTAQILEVFGEVSGLRTNFQKSCVIPIRCEETETMAIASSLTCSVSKFPCTYLGLPISDKKLRKADLLSWVERIGDKLPGWKANMMNMSGRATWVRFVLSALPIHVLIALNVPKWFIKAINKIRRAFLWKGRKEAQGGCCLVAWEKVQRPLELGGLGIPNLEIMGWALQVRWLWLRKTDSSKPWLSLDIPIHANVLALFQVGMQTSIGNGTSTKFWKDKWINGSSVRDIAPLVVAAVPTRIRNMSLVAEAMVDNRWAQDIQGGLSMIGIYELFQLSNILSEFVLTQEEDVHTWRFEASGQYTAKSAYLAFFNGAINFEPWRRIWKSWAPAKCKIFLWLAVRNRCWTADRLERRNLPHTDRCLLCDQEPENIQHILTTCVFAREFWFRILAKFDWQVCTPLRDELSFSEWWRTSVKKIQKDKRKGFNTLVILGAWLLWKHRNACVFEGDRPNLDRLLQAFKDEHHLWCLAGARSLSSLSAGQVFGLG